MTRTVIAATASVDAERDDFSQPNDVRPVCQPVAQTADSVDSGTSDESAEHVLKTKAGRLAVAAAVAPSLRRNGARAQSRRVFTTSPNGEVVRVISGAQMQASILARAGIELAPTDGSRPTHSICRMCTAAFRQPGKGRLNIVCGNCRKSCCASCDGPLSRGVFSEVNVRKRNGRPPTCKKCLASSTWGSVRERLPTPACCDCGAKLSRRVMYADRVRARNGGPPRCRRCACVERERLARGVAA